MGKILISWYALNNDFLFEQHGARKRKLEMVNEDGPTFNVHRHFGKEYETHILLNSSKDPKEVVYFNLLVSELRSRFKLKVEPRNIVIDDPISISEIFKKISVLLLEYKNSNVEIFVSPGTPQMQIAWYLVKPNFKKNVTLFQIREAKYTEDKKTPERIYTDIDTYFNPNILSLDEVVEKNEITGSNVHLNDSLKPIYYQAKQISKVNDIGCLILGENGTGKGELARYIHNQSDRHKASDKFDEHFKAVNCAAYDDDLLRSELFGHEEGSFTGATKMKIGIFEAADKGTIFLDEIGDISKKMQVTLLRVLQEKKIQRVGGVEEIPIDVRVIAATNIDIEDLCETGEFRRDLYYRLAETTLKLPPLRNWTKIEIKNLIENKNSYYFSVFRHRKEKLKFNKDVIDCLTSYQYKGNVRELQNIIKSLYVFCENDVTMPDLPERIRNKGINSLLLSENEKSHIINVFKIKKRNISQTAKALGISRDTLKKKLNEYGLRDRTEKEE